jgi:D-alanyl-D-alanine carboxypeptidase
MLMKEILKVFIVTYLIIHLVGCNRDPGSPDIPEFKPPTLPETRLNEVVQDFYHNNGHCVLGVFALVQVPEYQVWKVAVGDFDASRTRKLKTDDKFILGSVSKTFTATIILQLMEEGKVHLDTSIINYLPESTRKLMSNESELMEQEYNLDSITVRQLLNHESGIADFINIPAFSNGMQNEPTSIISPNTIISYILEYREPYFSPGTSHQYSSTNYILLGIMAEHICGKPFYLILKEKICQKIGLENTHLHSFDPDEGEIAHGYYGVIDGPEIHGSYGWTAGTIVSSIEDLGKFMRALASGNLFQNKSTFDLMVTPGSWSTFGLGISERYYGYGISYGHSGKTPGYRAAIAYNVEKDAVMCLGITTHGIQELPNHTFFSSFLDIIRKDRNR